MEVISNEKVKARKQHICDYCGYPILKKEVYQYQTNRNDGDLYHWKSHLKCESTVSDLGLMDLSYDGLTGEDFQDAIRQKYYDIMASKYPEVYESKTFVIPSFGEMLKFVQASLYQKNIFETHNDLKLPETDFII